MNKRLLIYSALYTVLASAGVGNMAYAQTPPPQADEAAQQLLDKTKDDAVLEQLKKQHKKGLEIDREEVADTLQGKDKDDSKEDEEKIRQSGILSKLPSAENLQKLKDKTEEEPNNLDHYFAYAQMASSLGEYQKAAHAYEAMLTLVPNLHRVRLDLGSMYLRLGRFEDAKNQMEQVLAQDPPEEVKNNIDRVMAQIDSELREHNWSGSVAFGLNFDSNANSAPNGDQIRIRDTLVNLGPSQQVQEDYQLFGAATVNHSYRPAWGKGEKIDMRWNSSGTVYRTEQEFQDGLDLQLISVKTGPEFRSRQSGIKITPEAGILHIVLDGHSYLRTYSGELKGEWPVSNHLLLNGSAKHEFREFMNSPTVSTYEDRTGSASQASAGARYVITPTNIVDTTVTLRRERTRQEYYDNTQLGGSLGYTKVLPHDMFANAKLGYKNTIYDDNDSLISAKTRHDKERTVGLTVGKSFAHGITVTGGYQYRDVNSNIENYRYDNHRFSTAVSVRF